MTASEAPETALNAPVSHDLGVYPARGRAFIRHIETESTYRGGKVLIPDHVRDKVARQQFVVLALGDYEYCEDEESCTFRHTKRGEHRHHLMVGDWILARNRAWSSTPDPGVYVIRVADILGVFREE
jgi:co-chaperonin GroES (HSP10)